MLTLHCTACYWLPQRWQRFDSLLHDVMQPASSKQRACVSYHAQLADCAECVPHCAVLLQASFERVSAFATTIINFYIWMFNVLFGTAQKAFGAVAGATDIHPL
jgi:hypothetical protein